MFNKQNTCARGRGK